MSSNIKFVPDLFARTAGIDSQEGGHGVEEGTEDDYGPRAVEHEGVDCPIWCKHADVLESDGHFDAEAQGSIEDFENIDVLQKLAKADRIGH